MYTIIYNIVRAIVSYILIFKKPSNFHNVMPTPYSIRQCLKLLLRRMQYVLIKKSQQHGSQN